VNVDYCHPFSGLLSEIGVDVLPQAGAFLLDEQILFNGKLDNGRP
jgi:hypothetical protein